MIGKIFEIKHFAVHDGPGIRTTVFFKGCPLRCVWCHNPEGLRTEKQLSYLSHMCQHCGRCVSACPNGAHTLTAEHQHQFDRAKCTQCGACADACLGKALLLYGRDVSVDDLMPELLEDQCFYESSGGGVTLSGGECLIQAEFCAELLKQLKKQGVHTAVDTCGFVPRQNIEKVLPYTDIFLYDIKALDTAVHQTCTGFSNDRILENLKWLNDCGKAVEIRVPYVPDHNAGEMEQIADFLRSLSCIVRVKVLPYHNYAGSKYKSLDMDDTLPNVLPTDEEMSAVRQLFRAKGLPVAE